MARPQTWQATASRAAGALSRTGRSLGYNPASVEMRFAAVLRVSHIVGYGPSRMRSATHRAGSASFAGCLHLTGEMEMSSETASQLR